METVGWMVNGANPGLKYWRTVAGQFMGAIVQAVSDSEGAIYALTFRNPGAAAAYVNIYDVPSGKVTVGTTVPVARVCIPPAVSGTPGQLIVTPGPYPVRYCAAGISVAAIDSDSDSGSSAPGSPIYGEIQYVRAPQPIST